jgi:antitoxin component YwqK of YwqJK toxin-antitoxin module
VESKPEGSYEEYYDNGQLKSKVLFTKGFMQGDLISFDEDGAKSSVFDYEDNILRRARFYDKSGKELGHSEKNREGIDLVCFQTDGSRYRHCHMDAKGKLKGDDSLYFLSGKPSSVEGYLDDQQSGNATSYYPNGNKKTETGMEEGKSTGVYTSYFAHGQVQRQGWNTAGQSEGEWVSYDEMGNLSSKTFYQDDAIAGYHQEFYPNGKLSMEKKFHTGWMVEMNQYDTSGRLLVKNKFPDGNGSWLQLHMNGSKKEEGHMKDGYLEGLVQTYYFDGSLSVKQYFHGGYSDSLFESYYYKGPKSVVGSYQTGKKSGQWMYYEENGSLSYIIDYENDEVNGKRIFLSNNKQVSVQEVKAGKRNGLSRRYDEDGTLAYTIRYVNDRAMGYTYNGPDGKPVAEIPLVRGSANLKTFFPNGKPSRVCRFDEGMTNGWDTLFYTNGNVLSVDSTSFGNLEGINLEYHSNGKIKREKHFLHDNLHGIFREFDEKGILTKEAFYYNGTLHGSVKYFKNGKLTETRYYFYDDLITVKNGN